MSADPKPVREATEKEGLDQPPELPRFRYSLQSLFVAVAAFCFLLGGMVAAGPIGGFVLFLGVMAVAAHVFGAVLGKSLRDATSERLAQKPVERSPIVVVPNPEEAAWQHQPIEPNLVGPIGIGAVIGAIAGGSVLAWLNWERATIANVAFGTAAFATLGRIGGFALMSFWRALQTSLASSLKASETKRPEKPNSLPH